MDRRLELQTLLENLLDSLNYDVKDEDIENKEAFEQTYGKFVYFQPPENVKIKHPCIIYTRDTGKTKFADDTPYSHHTQYLLTVIDKNPVSRILSKIAMLPMCVHVQHYTKDNFNHDVFNLYY